MKEQQESMITFEHQPPNEPLDISPKSIIGGVYPRNVGVGGY